jgi:hypothetical protein
MPTMVGVTSSVEYPVAIRDKDLPDVGAFRVEAHELCTVCGEGFGIGYLRRPTGEMNSIVAAKEWPGKLTEILAKDHRQDRLHKRLIELDH